MRPYKYRLRELRAERNLRLQFIEILTIVNIKFKIHCYDESMQHTIFTFSLSALLLANCSVQANELRKQPIEIFTQSLTSFYIVLDRCQKQDQDTTPIASIMQALRIYVAGLYKGDAPYWALPQSDNYIQDQEMCGYLLYDRMMAYDVARREYMKAYPDDKMPPRFNLQQPKNYEYMKRRLDPERASRSPEYDW